MLNELDYSIEEGESSPYDICVYALSTCGFCKKGINFLREKKVKFRYIYFTTYFILQGENSISFQSF